VRRRDTTATAISEPVLIRHRGRRRPATPAELAKRVFSDYRVTPTLALISDALVDIENPNRRYIVSTPPRTGKSVLFSQVGTVFALMRNPDHQLILKSYSDELAEEHSPHRNRQVHPGDRLATKGTPAQRRCRR
jgi:hypothetical protein